MLRQQGQQAWCSVFVPLATPAGYIIVIFCFVPDFEIDYDPPFQILQLDPSELERFDG